MNGFFALKGLSLCIVNPCMNLLHSVTMSGKVFLTVQVSGVTEYEAPAQLFNVYIVVMYCGLAWEFQVCHQLP